MVTRRAGSSLGYSMMRGTVSFEGSMVRVETYSRYEGDGNTAGMKRRIIPLSKIASVSVRNDIKLFAFLFGITTMVFCLWLRPEGYLKCLFIGLMLLMCSFRHSLVISLTSGEEISIDCRLGEKKKALEVENTFYRLAACDEEADEN